MIRDGVGGPGALLGWFENVAAVAATWLNAAIGREVGDWWERRLMLRENGPEWSSRRYQGGRISTMEQPRWHESRQERSFLLNRAVRLAMMAA